MKFGSMEEVLSGDATCCIQHGDCLVLLPLLPDNCLDSIVVDPPYEIYFAGWDKSGIAFSVEMWRECLRVLKPGGHLAAFGASRTYHRLACAIEDAGFEIRDQIDMIYGSGAAHCADASKAVDELHGLTEFRKVIGSYKVSGNAGTPTSVKGGTYAVGAPNSPAKELLRTTGADERSQMFDGWYTGLAPGKEPIVLARKPLDGSLAENLMKWGTGALNIDACRIATDFSERGEAWARSGHSTKPEADKIGNAPGVGMYLHPKGRWTKNVGLVHVTQAWYRLKNSISEEEKDAILDFYGAREAMRALREADDRNALRDRQEEVLLKQMYWRITRGDSQYGLGDADLQRMRERLSSEPGRSEGREEKVLQQRVSSEVLGQRGQVQAQDSAQLRIENEDERTQTKLVSHDGKVLSMEGGASEIGSWLCECHDRSSPSRLAGDGDQNGRGWDDVYSGAQNRCGDDGQSTIELERCGSSQERDQGRQSTGESGGSIKGGAFSSTQGIRAQVGDAGKRSGAFAQGELRFEVDARKLPVHWLDRFEGPFPGPGCVKLGQKKSKTPIINRHVGGPKFFGDAVGAEYVTDGGEPTTETVWECHPECPVAELARQSGESKSRIGKPREGVNRGSFGTTRTGSEYDDEGSAARYFNQFEWTEPDFDLSFQYIKKPSTAFREAGCEDIEAAENGRHNDHSTVKNLDVVRFLIRLTTRPGGITLSHFLGSGTDAIAAQAEGVRSIGFDFNPAHPESTRNVDIARARVQYWCQDDCRRLKLNIKPKILKKDERQQSLFEVAK